MRNVAWKLVSDHFNFQGIFSKRESEEVSMLFGQILIVEVVLNSLKKQKELELVFRSQFCYNFLIKICPL